MTLHYLRHLPDAAIFLLQKKKKKAILSKPLLKKVQIKKIQRISMFSGLIKSGATDEKGKTIVQLYTKNTFYTPLTTKL